MSDTNLSTAPVPDQDAVELLIADHKRVARLFAQFDALKDDGNDEEKAAVVERICAELTVHTALEEEIFYPAVRKAIEEDDLMDEALVEHAGAKALIAQLRAADPGDDLYDAKVTVLGEQIDHHVEEEEGSMFPLATAAGVDTVALGASLLERKAQLLADPNALAPPARQGTVQDEEDAEEEEERTPRLKPLRPPPARRPKQSAAKKATKKTAKQPTAKKKR